MACAIMRAKSPVSYVRHTINTASDADVAKLLELAEPLKQAWIERMEPLGVNGAAALETFSGHIADVAKKEAAE